MQLGSLGPTVLFSRPQAVREVFQLPIDDFECRQFNEHYKYLMGESSLLVSDGPEHQRRRRLFAQLSQRPLKQYARRIAETTQLHINSWIPGCARNVRAELHTLCLDMMLRIVFGTGDASERDDLFELFRTRVYRDMGAWSPWTQLAQHQAGVRTLISNAAQRGRRFPSSEPSLLDVLLQAEVANGELLSEAEVQDHVLTLLLAGVDPAAIAINWALYWVLEHPSVLERLLREISQHLPTDDWERLARLPYLKAVCHESLRMYPIVTIPTGRKLRKPRYIDGYEFDAGVTLLPCTYLVHHRPELYPEPEEFRPERFLERSYSSCEFFPFGGGARICIGAALANVQMPIALAIILTTWQLRPAHRGPVEPVRHGTLIAPSDAMQVEIVEPGIVAPTGSACRTIH